ncbi:hypothetical protein Tco_1212120 [Tanacetum coccineum]
MKSPASNRLDKYRWLERSMILRANERMSAEAPRLCLCVMVMHEQEYRMAICPLLGSSFSFPFLVMSERNLLTITCSLFQSCLVDFVYEYGISLCYDPKLPSSNATALDAPKGGEATIPFFRSLLTLGPAGDLLAFQKRHGFGTPAIFGDSMSNIPKWKSEFIFVKQTLIFDIRPGLITEFRHGPGSFADPYPMELFDKVLQGRLCLHPFEAQTFSEPILYLASLTDSLEHATSIPSILVDGEEMAFWIFLKKPGQTLSFSVSPANHLVDVKSPSVGHLMVTVNDDQVKSSSYSRDKGVMAHELVVVREGCFEHDVMAVKDSKKRRSIIEALEEEATMVRPVSKKKKLEGSRRMSARGSVPPLSVTAPKGVGKHPRVLARYIGNLASSSDSLTHDVEEAHAAHNMISSLHYPLLKDKLGFLTFDELVDVYDIHALQMAVDEEGSQVLKDLRSKNALNLEELLMLQRVAASFKESRKKLVEEKSKEVFVLASKLEAVKLKKSKLVKEFLPLAVKKLFESEHFNQALGDLQQKAIMFGRSQALDEVHGLGDSWDLKDVQDYHPEVEKIFNEAA